MGKVARLPYVVRMEINRRLFDGSSLADVAAWANSLPEVRDRLLRHYGGRPITVNNMSNWRHSGYVDWLAARGEPPAFVTRLLGTLNN